MILSELTDELARLLKLEGWNDSNPEPQHASLINEALRLWSWEAEYVTATFGFNTVAGTTEYTLTSPPDWKLVTDLAFGTMPLKRSSLDQVRIFNRVWFQAANANPTHFFMIRPNVIRLYPPPASVEAVTGYGTQADADLALATDSPACPAHYHRALPRLAAWLYADAYTLGEGNARIQGYYTKAMEQAKDCQLWMASQNEVGLQRTVARRRPERTLMTHEESYVNSV